MKHALRVEELGGAVLLPVHVKPRASRSRIVGVRGGALDVALAAPPVEGAANDELVRLLASTLGVRRSCLRLASGARSRNKRVRIDGLVAEDILAKLGLSGKP